MRLGFLLLAIPLVLNCSSLWRDTRVHSIKEATYLLKITADAGNTAALDKYLASRKDEECVVVYSGGRRRPSYQHGRWALPGVSSALGPFGTMKKLREALAQLAKPKYADRVLSGGCYLQIARRWREAQKKIMSDHEAFRREISKGWYHESAKLLREAQRKWKPFAKPGCRVKLGDWKNATSISGSEGLGIGDRESQREFDYRKNRAERAYGLLMDAVNDRMGPPLRVRRRSGWLWTVMPELYTKPLAHLLRGGSAMHTDLKLSLGCYIQIAKMLEKRSAKVKRVEKEAARLNQLDKRFFGIKKDCRDGMLTETPRCKSLSGLSSSDRKLCQKVCAEHGMSRRYYVVRNAAKKCAAAYRSSGEAPLSCTLPENVSAEVEPILQSNCRDSCSKARAHYDAKSEERWEAADKESCRAPASSWDCNSVRAYTQRGGKLAHAAKANAMLKRAKPALTRFEKKEEKDAERAASQAAAAAARSRQRRCRVWRTRLATHGSCSSYCAWKNRGNRGGFDLGYGLCTQSCSRCRR